MKVTAIQDEVFTLLVNKEQLPGMQVVSRWEGLTKLRNGEGQVLIVTGLDRGPVSFGYAFGDIFDQIFRQPEAGSEILVVAGSPALLQTLKVLAQP